ncbi:uncharacterized protein ABDE67_013999 [Symphorus nematophorus]
MEESYINITSQNNSYEYSNTTSDHNDYSNTEFIHYVVTVVIICISLPLTLVTIYALYSQEFGHRLPTVVPLQTNHQELCGRLATVHAPATLCVRQSTQQHRGPTGDCPLSFPLHPLHHFYESVVGSAILYTVACWGNRLRVVDCNRLNKLIRKARDVVGVEFVSLTVVSERRMLSKLRTILDNVSHPLQEVRKDHVAPIYVLNLLISDFIQLCCMIVWVATTDNKKITKLAYVIYIYSLMVSAGFMVCIALERYLVIAHPLWYRCRRTIKSSVVVCVLVWALPLVYVLISIFFDDFETNCIVISVFFLIPFPLFIFFLGGTLKALSASRTPSDEKRRIVGVLVLVLLIYTLLFLPAISFFVSMGNLYDSTLTVLFDIFVEFSPLADLTLYVFMRKGIIDKLLSSVCCCRMDSDDTNSSSV